MTKSSCLDCKYVKTWSFLGDLENPPESDWECSLELDCTAEVDDMDLPSDEEEVAKMIASTCPKFEYFNWSEYEHQQDKAAIEQCLEDWKLLEEYNL
jgi:hypothetical protein